MLKYDNSFVKSESPEIDSHSCLSLHTSPRLPPSFRLFTHPKPRASPPLPTLHRNDVLLLDALCLHSRHWTQGATDGGTSSPRPHWVTVLRNSYTVPVGWSATTLHFESRAWLSNITTSSDVTWEGSSLKSDCVGCRYLVTGDVPVLVWRYRYR